MKKVKIELANALLGTESLTSIVGDRIGPSWPKSKKMYPCVTYYKVAGSSSTADGKLCQFQGIYSLDLFGLSSEQVEDMALGVREAINKLPFMITEVQDTDLPDPDPDVHHKILRYLIKS